MRVLTIAVLLSCPVLARGECFPTTPLTAGEAEKDLSAVMCRTFREMGATRARVSVDGPALTFSLTFDDLAVVEAFGKPALAKDAIGGVFDDVPKTWTAEGRTVPRVMYFAVWSTDPTDRKPRVVWTRKGPGSPLTLVKSDGLALTR